MRTRQRSKSHKINTVVPILLVLIDLLLVWFIKYYHHNLSLEQFRLGYIGNIFNLIFAVILIAGLIIVPFTKAQFKSHILYSYSLSMSIVLAIGIISAFFPIPFKEFYILEHPFHEFLTAFLFSAFQFIQFVFISFVWIKIIGGRDLIFLNSSVNGIIIVFLLLCFAFVYVNKNFQVNQLTKHTNNVAVVLGAAVWSKNKPSPSLASRVDKAAFLYKSKIADKILLTGSNAPGELSESEVAYRRLISKNIDDSVIMTEKHTTSTVEQIRYIRENLILKRNYQNIIIVSDSYHLTRVREICNFYGIKVDIVSSDLNFNFEHKIFYKIRESIALMTFWLFAL